MASSSAPGARGEEDKMEEARREQEFEPSRMLMFILCIIHAIEGADVVLVPSAMKALQAGVHFQLTDVAYLTVAQAVFANLAAPIWGILADRGVMGRKSILVTGALGQGVVTIILAFSVQLWPMVVLRAVEGVMAAALRPVSLGIIADSTSEGRRGKIFGRCISCMLLGMFLSSLMVVNMANKTIMGVQGWRLAFGIVGAAAAGVSALIAALMTEPPVEVSRSSSRGLRAVREELGELLAFIRVPTFCVLVVQGIFQTIPWSCMGYMVLYFQLCGLSDVQASVLAAETKVSGAIGQLFSGCVADGLARRLGPHGRPLSAQISVALGMPLKIALFYGIRPGEGSFAAYFFLLAGFGLTSWAVSGTNFPILSEIVPAHKRSRIMAWEGALEHSVGHMVGSPAVALLASKAFGYRFGKREAAGQSIPAADALGKAITIVLASALTLCLICYTFLHWSYPRDLRRLQAEKAAAAAAAGTAKKSASWPAGGAAGAAAADGDEQNGGDADNEEVKAETAATELRAGV